MKKGLKMKTRRGKPKTKLLEEKFGGKWKYMGFGGGWKCNDENEKRWVSLRYSFCDEELYHGSIFPSEYYMYEKDGDTKRLIFGNNNILVF